MPCLELVTAILVVDGVKVDRDVGRNLNEGSEIKHPSEEVDPSCKEAEHTAPARSSGNGGPVVDSSGSRYR